MGGRREERLERGETVVWLLLGGRVRHWRDNKLQMEATAPFLHVLCVCVWGGL